MPKKYFVTRHRGAVTWAAEGGVRARKVEIENFDPQIVRPGDIVMGTLPVHISAEVNRRGGHYWHLAMDVPAEWRGRELSPDEMRTCGAHLREFSIQDLGIRMSSEPDLGEGNAAEDDRTQICIASAQLLPSVLPLLTLPWRRLLIYASRDMHGRAEYLQEVLTGSLNLLGPDSGRDCRIVAMPPKVDWDSLSKFARAQAESSLGHGPLDFNLTGGTKLMSLAFADAFRSQARLFYCSTDTGTLEILDAVSQAPRPLAADRLDLKSYISVQGFRVVRSQRSESPAKTTAIHSRESLTARLTLSAGALEKSPWNVDGRELCLASSKADLREVKGIERASTNVLGALHQLAAESMAKKGPGGRNLRQFRPWTLITDVQSTSPWHPLLNACESAGLIQHLELEENENGGHFASFRFRDEGAAAYLAGGYLEEFVWLSLSGIGLPESHFDANLGIGLPNALKTRNKSSSELNELDAAVLWNNRLLIIECKAGGQLTGAESQAVIQKLDQLKHNVAGTLGEGWVIASRPLSETQHADVLQRADLNKLQIVHGRQGLTGLSDRLAASLGHPNKRPWPGALLDDLNDFSGRPFQLG